MRVSLLNFEGGPGVPLLNFEGGSGIPLLNFEGGSRVPESRDPKSWGPSPTFTPCPIKNDVLTLRTYNW